MFDHPFVVRLVKTLAQQALPRRREAGEEDLVHELVAEAEAEAIDPQDSARAQALELLDELDLVETKQRRERLRPERLLEHGRREQEPIRPGALGAALGSV
jgi:hypothetical protein